MMATAPAVPQQSLMREFFGLTLKHAAVIFAVIYGIGFLVLSIHHARFGLETTEPFKPKVFSAGVLFVVLTGAPCIAMARFLNMFGLKMPKTQVVTGKGAAYIVPEYILDFWLVAVCLRMGSAVLFSPFDMVPRYPGWLFWIIYSAVTTTASVWLMDMNRSPVRTIIIKFVLFASLVAIVFKYSSHEFFLQVIWFYGVGLVFLWMRYQRHQESAHTYDWERQCFALVGIVGFFAVFVYGHIWSAYGGGAPIRIDMSFTRATSFSANKTDGGFLVDQDSQGFYVVHQPKDTETHFIPRDAVGEIVFHGN
jgi:hypothetical protein